MQVSCNFALPDDEPVGPQTCRSWRINILFWFWRTVAFVGLHCGKRSSLLDVVHHVLCVT